MDIKVSVIIPVYNAKAFLRYSLACILRQSLREIEIIAIDDGSTDGSLQVLEEYAKQDKRLKVLTQPSSGAGAARNAGIAAAKGKYLYFMDADDCLADEALRTVYARAEKVRADIAIFNYNILRAGEVLAIKPRFGNLKGQTFFCAEEEPEAAFAFGSNVWDKLYRREFIQQKNIRFDNCATCNDVFFAYYAHLSARRIAGIEQWLYTYRADATGNISSKRGKYAFCLIETLQHLKCQMLEDGIWEMYKRPFKACCRHHIEAELYVCSPEQKKFFYQEARKRLTMREYAALFAGYRLAAAARCLFSVKNSADKRHKIFTVLGIKLKFFCGGSR